MIYDHEVCELGMGALRKSTDETPLISIIILNYNAREFSVRCIDSVLRTDYPNFEVVFCDNASADGSVESITKHFGYDARLRIVSNKKNYGAAEGNNIGASHARVNAKYLVFLNNDTEVDATWLKWLANVMDKNEKVGAAGCKQLLIDNHQVIDIAGTQMDKFGFLYPRGRLEKDQGQLDQSITEVFTYGSTALMVRKSIFDRIGGFDQKYFGWYEDNDLCWRVRLAGFRVVSVPKAKVYHAVSGSMRKLPKPTNIYYAERNKFFTLIKNYTLCSALEIMPVLMLFYFSQMLFFLVAKKIGNAFAMVRAINWIILNFKVIWIKHLKVQYIVRRISDREIKMQMVKINPMHLWKKARSV